MAELERLPGVGPYTARAVACFAGDAAEAVMDTNIRRVVGRHRLGLAAARPGAEVEAAAHAMLPAGPARDHNLALMDLGALVCRARRPVCESCPVQSGCAWRAAGLPGGARNPGRPVRFETTARFARGRIVAILRTRDMQTTDDLRDALPAQHRAATAGYIASLVADGLLERAGAGWQLAEAQPLRESASRRRS